MKKSPTKTVLIVDDDPDIRFLITEYLSERGFDVAEAGDGLEALSFLEKGGMPCLILLDLMMPRMNGWEFRAEQLKNPLFGAVPTVIYTGVANPGEAARKLNAAGYIAKSMRFDAILEWTDRFCSGGAAKN